MLILSEKDLIARSGTRECYSLPHDSGKIVKIVREGPNRGGDANQKEWRHYRFIMKRHGPQAFIPVCHGFWDTNRGRGLVFDCIRDADGRVSPMLKTVLAVSASQDMTDLIPRLTDLCQTIIEKNIQLFDLNLANILIQRQADQTCRPVVVDIKGRYNNYEFIPVSTHLPFFSRKKLTRRCAELMGRVHALGRKSSPS